jgi:hypothetical protein
MRQSIGQFGPGVAIESGRSLGLSTSRWMCSESPGLKVLALVRTVTTSSAPGPVSSEQAIAVQRARRTPRKRDPEGAIVSLIVGVGLTSN